MKYVRRLSLVRVGSAFRGGVHRGDTGTFHVDLCLLRWRLRLIIRLRLRLRLLLPVILQDLRGEIESDREGFPTIGRRRVCEEDGEFFRPIHNSGIALSLLLLLLLLLFDGGLPVRHGRGERRQSTSEGFQDACDGRKVHPCLS